VQKFDSNAFFLQQSQIPPTEAFPENRWTKSMIKFVASEDLSRCLLFSTSKYSVLSNTSRAAVLDKAKLFCFWFRADLD